MLTGVYDSYVFDNNYGNSADPGCPNIAGFAPNEPVWYQWTAPRRFGEVELDTIGSSDDTYGTPLNTVLAVFTGNATDITTLNQVAANDDLFPLNSSIPRETDGQNYSGSGDYAQLNFQPLGLGGPGSEPVFLIISHTTDPAISVSTRKPE